MIGSLIYHSAREGILWSRRRIKMRMLNYNSLILQYASYIPNLTEYASYIPYLAEYVDRRPKRRPSVEELEYEEQYKNRKFFLTNFEVRTKSDTTAQMDEADSL